jgi:hypothetical protein
MVNLRLLIIIIIIIIIVFIVSRQSIEITLLLGFVYRFFQDTVFSSVFGASSIIILPLHAISVAAFFHSRHFWNIFSLVKEVEGR